MKGTLTEYPLNDASKLAIVFCEARFPFLAFSLSNYGMLAGRRLVCVRVDEC